MWSSVVNALKSLAETEKKIQLQAVNGFRRCDVKPELQLCTCICRFVYLHLTVLFSESQTLCFYVLQQAFMCLPVRFVFVSCAFQWICSSAGLLAESTAHWSAIKPSCAAGTACKRLCFETTCHHTSGDYGALLSLSLCRTHSSYYTICKTLHQWGTCLFFFSLQYEGTITSLCNRPLRWVSSDKTRCHNRG